MKNLGIDALIEAAVKAGKARVQQLERVAQDESFNPVVRATARKLLRDWREQTN
jgi:hypothetical protein